MKLTVGDKVRIKESGEGAEILEVIDEKTAMVDTFDGEIKIQAIEIEPFQAGDVKREFYENVEFYSKAKKTKAPNKDPQKEWNTRKNQFRYELDLHAENLIGDIESKSNEEILSIQLSRVRQYIDQAMELKIQRVYLIHGIGSGRLKSEIHNLLQQIKQVKSFENKYHSSYGMGATEVKLR